MQDCHAVTLHGVIVSLEPLEEHRTPCWKCIALSFALCILTAKTLRLRAFMKDFGFLAELSGRQYTHSFPMGELGLISLWPAVALSPPGPCGHGDTADAFVFMVN